MLTMLTTLPVIAPVVAEPTTPIKPSEALRLGRLLRPRRIEGTYTEGADGACAIGAMLAGGMRLSVAERTIEAAAEFCPVCNEDDEVVIVHLNDAHHWSDDQIVAWLESLGL